MTMPSKALWLLTPSKSDQARLKLLQAALLIFGDKGMQGASVREIAKAAGQNVAAIAYYFGSKEKLYHAVVEGLVREVRHHMADVVVEMARLRSQTQPDRTECLRVLKLFLRSIFLRVLSRKEALPIARLIVREQMGPTPGFEILYQQGFRELHEGLCFLVGAILDQDPRDRNVILRTHMLMGQVYFFAMSREAILRRLGWSTLEGENAEIVVRLLDENLDTLLTALQHKKPARTELK